MKGLQRSCRRFVGPRSGTGGRRREAEGRRERARGSHDSIVKDGPSLPKLHRPETKPDTRIVHIKYEGKGKFTEAWIYFTISEGKWKNRKWNFIQCSIGDEELVSQKALPKAATAFLVYVFRDRGGYRDNHAASELVEFLKK